MNIRRRSFSIILFSLASFCIFSFSRVTGDPVELRLTLIPPNRTVELNLTGDAGAAYTIETSLNLSSWFALATGTATNGILTVRHDPATNSSTFYRGRGVGGLLPSLTVAPKVDTNFTASALVSLAGGSAVLYGRDGVRFTLTVESNSVPDAGIITMTLVTNVTGLPFARGVLGAVRIEPANLAIWRTASLEIMFPTNINRREVSSFFARADGTAFRLTPDRVGTNVIVIPVARLGLYGSSLVTAEELANAARIDTGDRPALAANRLAQALHGATAQCFPEKEIAANQAAAEIDQAAAVIQQQIAALLGVERQKQLADETSDSSTAISEVSALMCGFYSANIAPRWAAAADNCALGEVLIRNTLLIERQRQLLGAPEDDKCPGMSSIPFCAIFKSCLKDIRDCCAMMGMRGPAKVAAVFGLQRQDALLGLNCISQSEAQEVIELCSSNAWTGTFSMTETGSRTHGEVDPNGVVLTEVDRFTATFEGAVEESEENGAAEIGFLVELKIVGAVTQSAFHKRQFDSSRVVPKCPEDAPGGIATDTGLNTTTHSAAGSTTYTISFITKPDFVGYYFFDALNYDPDNPNPPKGTISLLSYQDSFSPCYGRTISKNETFTRDSPYNGNRSLDGAEGDMSDPNVVSGSFSIEDPTLAPPRQITFKWNFRRHPAGLNP